MNCTASSLMQEARCYQCLPKNIVRALELSLLCQWATHLTPPPALITWTPDTEGGTYNGGTPFADLAAFRAIDPTTVTDLNLSAKNITSISNIASLVNLQSLNLDSLALAAGSPLDLTGCSNLVTLTAISSNFGSIILTGCTSLQTIDIHSGGFAGAIDATTCTALTSLICAVQSISSVDVHGLLNLLTLWCSFNNINDVNASGCSALLTLRCDNNQLGNLNITGDFAITTLDISSNPGVVVIGP